MPTPRRAVRLPPPNPRLQRTPVRPAGGRSPLSRKPLGDTCRRSSRGSLIWPTTALVLSVGCLSQVRRVDREGTVPLPAVVRCIAVEVVASTSGGPDIRDDLVRQIQAAMPGTEVIVGHSAGDVLVLYQQDDMIICTDCGDQNGTRGQHWWWFLFISKREFDPTCGADVTKTVATFWGENHKLGERPTRSAARQLHKLLTSRSGST
jgi:hypothetical protein